MEVFQSCSQFVEQSHIFLEKAEQNFHYLIFDEFEKIHTETEFTDDIADVLSEFIIWFPEKNRLGIACPEEMYNHAVLKNDAVSAVSVRARAPFSCLSVCDHY
ncbi:MAG: hypothetical protein TV41_07310 [Wolbachia endosymbiont of Dactylopius coccus]|nr:MAG: hypothetical protein TV41_07310 [Wolbachia endosymbiont of Dactylopius coccus]